LSKPTLTLQSICNIASTNVFKSSIFFKPKKCQITKVDIFVLCSSSLLLQHLREFSSLASAAGGIKTSDVSEFSGNHRAACLHGSNRQWTSSSVTSWFLSSALCKTRCIAVDSVECSRLILLKISCAYPRSRCKTENVYTTYIFSTAMQNA
jgi:hypothetical protein